MDIKLSDAFLSDAFLSEEDLDLKNLSIEELYSYWDFWLLQAQVTNDLDANTYSHSAFLGPNESLDDF